MQIDGDLFQPGAVDPETAAFVDELSALSQAWPRPSDFASVGEFRDFWESDDGPFGPSVYVDWAEQRTLPTPDGAEIPIRVLQQDSSAAVLMWLHGGGFVIGHEDGSDPRLERLGRATGVSAVSLGYRKAPEHKWPTAISDCEVAALWLIENAQAEFGTTQLFIGGISAGASLAVATILRLRDHHGFTDWAGAVLLEGTYDFRPTRSRTITNSDPLIDLETIEFFFDQYLSGTPAGDNLDSPEVSLVMADLTGLCPAHFTVGTRDPLLDENLTMAGRWQVAGNPTELRIYPGATHAFTGFPIPVAAEANDHVHTWMKRRIGATGLG